MKKILFFLIIYTFFNLQTLKADTIYFVDFSYILNQSTAGKGAQDFLKNKIKTENAKFNKLEKKILEDEKALIAKKNVLKNEEYKKQLTELRKRVATIQKNKRSGHYTCSCLEQQNTFCFCSISYIQQTTIYF